MKAWVSAKWAQFTQWAAWSAWNYARKREIARRKWIPKQLPELPADWNADQRRIRGNEARQVLENRHFMEAWEALHEYLEAQAASCDPDSMEKAHRIVISKQLLIGLRREFVRKTEDGYMAEVELDELNKRRRVVRFKR
jgi:hypothetical protein